MAYSGARGTLIYEKNLRSKISCQTPFKDEVNGFPSSSRQLWVPPYLVETLNFVGIFCCGEWRNEQTGIVNSTSDKNIKNGA
jgi:hypothetical protein